MCLPQLRGNLKGEGGWMASTHHLANLSRKLRENGENGTDGVEHPKLCKSVTALVCKHTRLVGNQIS